MTYQSSTIAAALAIRPYLCELLGTEAGKQMRQQLESYLKQFQIGDSTEDAIWELLTDTRETQVWVTHFRMETAEERSAFLPGNPSEISAPIFKCPLCERTWLRDRIGRPTPFCQEHNILLESV